MRGYIGNQFYRLWLHEMYFIITQELFAELSAKLCFFNLIDKGLRRICFPVSVAIFFWTAFSQNILASAREIYICKRVSCSFVEMISSDAVYSRFP